MMFTVNYFTKKWLNFIGTYEPDSEYFFTNINCQSSVLIDKNGLIWELIYIYSFNF